MRGTSQIDWIISLALFLLYVTWLFVFIMPGFSVSEQEQSLLELVQRRFESEFAYTIERIPVFVTHNSNILPVVMSYSGGGFSFEDGTPKLVWKNKLIFLAEPGEYVMNYGNTSFPLRSYVLDVTGARTTTENFSVTFSNSLPDSITYFEQLEANNFEYTLNGFGFVPIAEEYNETGFAGIYSASIGDINHTSLVFAQVPYVWNVIEPIFPGVNVSFGIEMDLHPYVGYWVDNSLFGQFGYENETSTTTFFSERVLLDDLYIDFSTPVNFTFMDYNNSLHLMIDAEISNFTSYRMVAGNINISNIDTDARMGTKKVTEGVYVNETNISKLGWTLPQRKDFYIEVRRNASARPGTTIATIGTPPDEDALVVGGTKEILIMQDGYFVHGHYSTRVYS